MTSSGNGAEPLLSLRGVSKNFGPVQALTDVDLDIQAGEVTALIGDNGAGKSVMIKCIAGIHAPERGEILWDGKPVRIRTPRDIGTRTIIAFATGCAYRQRLEHWLGTRVVPERVLEFGSYHAIVACVAAGSGIAVAPRSVVRALHADQDVSVHPLPAVVARAPICLVYRGDGPKPSAITRGRWPWSRIMPPRVSGMVRCCC